MDIEIKNSELKKAREAVYGKEKSEEEIKPVKNLVTKTSESLVDTLDDIISKENIFYAIVKGDRMFYSGIALVIISLIMSVIFLMRPS